MRRWPFEGREQELASVREAFVRSDRNALLIIAPAGVGKTRLVREALAGLNCRTEWIAATSAAATVPFGALAHLLPDNLHPASLIRAMCSRVARWGGRAHVAIAVDDAHLLDDASSTVIANVVATSTAFVVLTTRTGHPLADCLSRLVKEGDAAVLELSPLPLAAMDRLIDHSTGGQISAADRRQLHAAAGGNPLALRELLHGAMPGGLTDLVASRLDGLEPPTRNVVETVACGEPLPLSILEQLAGLAAVAAAEESGLVVCERLGARVQARLDHPMFGEVLRARMPVAQSQQIYRSLAEELLRTPMRRREDTLRAALWQVEAGEIMRPDIVRQGARHAVGRAGFMLAERLARRARDARPGTQADFLLAEILEYQGRSDEAAELLPETPPEQKRQRIRWAVARANWLYWARGDLTEALATLDAAAGHSPVEGARAFILLFGGRCAEAVQAARGVLDSPDSHPQGVVWATAAATAALGFLGRIDEAQDVRARGDAVAAAHAAALPWGAYQIAVGACVAHLACGDVRTAAALAADGYRTAALGGAPIMVNGWALYGGMVAANQGDLDLADRLLAEAVDGFDRTDTFRLRRCCLAAHAWVKAMRGNGPGARELMARADRLDNGTHQIFAPWIGVWRAWSAFACGEAAGALAHATHAADVAAAAGMPTVAAMACYEAARLGGYADSARMAGLPGPQATAFAEAARAISQADGAALRRAAEEMDQLGYHLHAAELATVAARALRQAGQSSSAALVTARATAMRVKCPGARTPLLARDDLGDLLTPREMQVALLAGRHTSRHIAGQLGLAVATVNNTLARAYTKLGITRREQLRALLDIDSSHNAPGPDAGG